MTYNRLPSAGLLRVALLENTSVIVVDNSDRPAFMEANLALARGTPGISIIASGGNLGMARALNRGTEAARKEQCRWIHTLDDDAIVPAGFFATEREWFDRLSKSGIRLGAVGPLVTDQCPRSRPPTFGAPWASVASLITSGTLTTPDIVAGVGGYNESLFVEGVDMDFSQRLRRAGYQLARLNELTVQQPFGIETESASLRDWAVDRFVSTSSCISLHARRSNSFHSRYGFYPLARRSEYWRSFRSRGETRRSTVGTLPSLVTKTYMLSSALLDFLATGDRRYVTTCLGTDEVH